MEWLNYLLKVSACTVLFFAFYLLVLKKLTFFKINRFFLLATLLFSFIIPTLKFTVEREVEQIAITTNPIALPDVELNAPAFQGNVHVKPLPIEQEAFDWYSLLPFLYGAIVGGLLIVAIWRLFQLIKHTQNSAEKINGLKLVPKKSGFTNCSFFNYVFIDEDQLTTEELEILLTHEEVHAKQFHSIDKIIMMIMKAFLWFNPVVYFYDKALEQTHEYEADEATSKDFGTNNYASLLLRLAVTSNQLPLVHNFVKSPIKSRIKMLFNDKSKAMKKLMYLLAIPVGLALTWGFTVDIVNVLPEGNTVQDQFTLVIDAGHGGKDKGAQRNGYSENVLTLNMAKKIKALAETQGIRVLLTRENDENISLAERAKVNGTVFLSLHVNSAPSNANNGIEMVTSGNYNEENLKLPKSNSFSYYLYKELKNLTGIKVNNKPQRKKLAVLDQNNAPGLALEMGYLTNNNDFKFITNAQQQDEFAKKIVNAIAKYKEELPANEKLQANFKKFNEEFQVKYKAWKNSEKYAWLVKETKNFKAQTLLGSIQSLYYTKRGQNQVLDGFILSANNKLYRIYLDQEQLKTLSFNAGDQVSLYAPKAEVWFDSAYPAIKPKKLAITPKVGAITLPKPKLLYSSTVFVDAKNDITFIKKGKMEIGEIFLEADDMVWDKNAATITAEKGTITGKNGVIVSGQSLVYQLKTNSYRLNNASGTAPETKASLYDLVSTLPYHAQDSVRVSKTANSVTLYGKAKINIDNNMLTGDKIEINKGSSVVTAYNATFTGVGKTTTITSKEIKYNITSKRIETKQY